MHIPGFQYHRPSTYQELWELLSHYGDDAATIAGGTDLLVRMKLGLTSPAHLASLMDISGIDSVHYEKGLGLSLGAGTRLTQIVRSPLIQEYFPALSIAASLVATHQIRNMATLGGNIMQNTRCMYYNRSGEWRKAISPCYKHGGNRCHAVKSGRRCLAVYQGDLAPLLMAYGASVELFANGTQKEIPLEKLFTGDGKTPFGTPPEPLLTRVIIPESSRGASVMYRKFRLRDGMDFPLAGVALRLRLTENTITDLRICLTAIRPSPVIVKEAAQIATGSTCSKALIKDIAEKAYVAARPVANLEESPVRRRNMVRIMVEEMLEEATETRREVQPV